MTAAGPIQNQRAAGFSPAVRPRPMFAMPTAVAQSRDPFRHPWRRAADAALMRSKERALAWMLPWCAVAGFITGCLEIRDGFDFLPQFVCLVALTVLAYRWCDADARLQRFEYWDIFVPALYVFPGPLAVVPAYLVATRRARCIRSLALAAIYLFALVAVALATRAAGLLLVGLNELAS